MECSLDDDESTCFANMTSYVEDDSFFKCLWNESREPTDEYIFFLINGSTTTVLNLIVLVIAFLYVDTRGKPSQIFVINMTAADLIAGIVVQLSRPFAPCFPAYFCGPYYVMAWMCQIGSVSHLLFLNLDKFLSIRIPLRYHVFVTRGRVILVAILCWVALFIISVLSYTLFAQFRNPLNPSCVGVKFNPAEYYAFLTIIAYVAPTILSFAISAYIFIIAQASSRRLGSMSERQRRMLMQRIFFVFSSTMWTFITCLPYRIGYTIYTICTQSAGRINDTYARVHSLQIHDTMMGDGAVRDFNFVVGIICLKLIEAQIAPYFTAKCSSGVFSLTGSYGYGPDACVGEAGLIAITYMYKLLQVGTIGNPIITVITQRQYRNRIVAAWRTVAKWFQLPQWCYSEEHREIITEARLTRLNSLNESQAFQIL